MTTRKGNIIATKDNKKNTRLSTVRFSQKKLLSPIASVLLTFY